MSNQDQIVALVTASLQGEEERMRALVLQMIAHEKRKGHDQVAQRLHRALEVRPFKPLPIQDTSVQGLLVEKPALRNLEDLVLPEVARKACLDLIQEHARRDALRADGIEPRSKVLLEGPPGNGKTALAGALAGKVGLPFLVARYDAIISSYLGETLSKMRRIFDYIEKRPCALLLDEVDPVGSERAAGNEVGEMRRAVTTLLTCLDEAPSTALIITATNHKEMLDRALWRRFQVRLSLPSPTLEQRITWLKTFESRTGLQLGLPLEAVAQELNGGSFAELEEFCTGLRRWYRLNEAPASPETITRDRLAEWQARSVA